MALDENQSTKLLEFSMSVQIVMVVHPIDVEIFQSVPKWWSDRQTGGPTLLPLV